MSPVATLCRTPAAFRPFRPRQRDDDTEDYDHPEHAEREIGQRLGVSEAEFGADKAGRP
jgi:hypothetical protein